MIPRQVLHVHYIQYLCLGRTPSTNIGRAFILAGPLYIGDDLMRKRSPTNSEPFDQPLMAVTEAVGCW